MPPQILNKFLSALRHVSFLLAGPVRYCRNLGGTCTVMRPHVEIPSGSIASAKGSQPGYCHRSFSIEPSNCNLILYACQQRPSCLCTSSTFSSSGFVTVVVHPSSTSYLEASDSILPTQLYIPLCSDTPHPNLHSYLRVQLLHP